MDFERGQDTTIFRDSHLLRGERGRVLLEAKHRITLGPPVSPRAFLGSNAK